MLSVQTQTYPKNDIDLNCGVCVAQYSSEEDLWVHMDIDHDVQKQDASQIFKCKNCEYTFGNSNDLKYHMKEKHDLYKNLANELLCIDSNTKPNSGNIGKQNFLYEGVS